MVDCRPRSAPTAAGSDLPCGGTRWQVPVPDFSLGRLDVDGTVTPGAAGPRVVLCAGGSVTVAAGGESVDVPAGHSAFVTAAAGQVTLTGSGQAFLAAPGLPDDGWA